LNKRLTLAHLAVGCAIDYIHHRLATIDINYDWLAAAPNLAEWYQEFQKHELMRETQPKEGW
jgi:glutathione S-transferase